MAKKIVTPGNLREALRCAWSMQTSYDPSIWSKEHPSSGQCTASALVVQDYLGGAVMRGNIYHLPQFASLRCHFWNQLDDGTLIDFTSEQFPKAIMGLISRTVYPSGVKRTRSSVLRYDSVRERYELLKESVEHNLAKLARRR